MPDRPPLFLPLLRDLPTAELEARRDHITRAMLGGPLPPDITRAITRTRRRCWWPFWAGVTVGWTLTRRRRR